MQYTIVGLDGTDENALDRRMAVRQDHISLGDELVESGNLLFAAAILDEETQQMKGSIYHLYFKTKQEFDQYLDKEPYIGGKVWNEVTIHTTNTRDPWQFTEGRDQAWFETYITA